MRSPLRKRLPRELFGEFGKYMVIFLFMTLTIGFSSGFLVAGDSMIIAYDESFDKYQIEHGHFETKESLKNSMLDKLEDGNKTIYPMFYKDESMDNDCDGKEDATLRIFENREDVNLVCVMDGALPAADDEIAIDRMYADNNSLETGDIVEVAGVRMRITGLVALSDYSALFSDNNDTMFDSVKFGVACMTQSAYKQFADADNHYQYVWRYEEEPVDETQENDWSDAFLELLSKQAFQSGITIEDYIPRYANQAIQFTGDDMGGDRTMMVVLLYIIIVIMAFVFSVTIKHTITKEAAVIGTLRASGYTRGELLRHYLAMPMLISLIAALIGNLLGYTVFKNMVADMYYGSYSLPTYETVWNTDAFVLTTVWPLVIMAVTNGYVLIKRLRLSPLQFLRRDLSTKQKKKAVRLPHFPFFTRFRMRIVLQNRSSYATLLLGLIFASVLLLFGLMMEPMLTDFQDTILENMIAEYQYVLKNQVETENPDAEKYCLSALSYHTDQREEDISVYGIEPESKYLKATLPDEGVAISDAFSEKYEVQQGDTIHLYENYGSDEYEFKVTEIIEYPSALAVFMPRDMYIDVFDPQVSSVETLMTEPELFMKQYASPEEQEYFTGYFSNEELTDIDEKYIASCITRDDLTKVSRQLEVSMGSIFGMFKWFAVALGAILIYLLTKIILEKNASSISMVKILGYENGEIAALYMVSTTVVVACSVLVGMVVSSAFILTIWKAFMMDYSGWLPPTINSKVYPEMFVMMMVGYGVVAALQFGKIQKIPMEDALKNVE